MWTCPNPSTLRHHVTCLDVASFDDCHREFQQLSLPHHQILESVGGQMASASLCSVRAVWLCPFLPFIAFSSVPTYHLVPQLMQSSRHNFDSINIGSTHVGHTCSKKEMISFYWCLIILIVWFFFFCLFEGRWLGSTIFDLIFLIFFKFQDIFRRFSIDVVFFETRFLIISRIDGWMDSRWESKITEY